MPRIATCQRTSSQRSNQRPKVMRCLLPSKIGGRKKQKNVIHVKNPAAGQIPDGWLLRGLCHHLHHAHVDALYGFLFRTRGHKAPRKKGNGWNGVWWRVACLCCFLRICMIMYLHTILYNNISWRVCVYIYDMLKHTACTYTVLTVLLVCHHYCYSSSLSFLIYFIVVEFEFMNDETTFPRGNKH